MTTGAGSFQTDVGTMEAASRHVYEVNEAIQAQLGELQHRLEPLLGTWQGAAAASFHALKDRWHEQATRLNDALRGIGDGLVQAQRNYASSEDANQQGFTVVTGDLA